MLLTNFSMITNHHPVIHNKIAADQPALAHAGMVQANVGQKPIICDILWVIFGDRFLFFHATSLEMNAIHNSIIIM